MTFFLFIFMVGPLLFTSPLNWQEVNSAQTVRNIRVKKLAQNWKGKVVTITNADGSKITGRLVDADLYRFVLEKNKGKKTEIPIDQISIVTLSPGLVEMSLTIVTGLLAGGFAAGFVSLNTPNASASMHWFVSLVGVFSGSWIGYLTFYQEEIIELE